MTKLATLPDSTEANSDPTKDTFGEESKRAVAGGDELDFLSDQPKMSAPGAATSSDPFSSGFSVPQKPMAASNPVPSFTTAGGSMGQAKPMQAPPAKAASIDPFASMATPNLNS